MNHLPCLAKKTAKKSGSLSRPKSPFERQGSQSRPKSPFERNGANGGGGSDGIYSSEEERMFVENLVELVGRVHHTTLQSYMSS